jgi:hypothetical protein
MEEIDDSLVQLSWFGVRQETVVDIDVVWCKVKPAVSSCQVYYQLLSWTIMKLPQSDCWSTEIRVTSTEIRVRLGPQFPMLAKQDPKYLACNRNLSFINWSIVFHIGKRNELSKKINKLNPCTLTCKKNINNIIHYCKKKIVIPQKKLTFNIMIVTSIRHKFMK